MNRKKRSDATVDINDSNNGEPVKVFIIQVAALSCAATQVPEITAAIRSFLNAGFRSAAQVEFVVMIEGLIPLQRQPGFQGQYAKAEPLCQRALAIRENALGPQHPNVATSLCNLAGLYSAQGQYAKAEAFYQRALAIWEKALGPEHPHVAWAIRRKPSR